VLKASQGRLRARFFNAGAVIAEQVLESGDSDLEVSMPRLAFEALCRAEGLSSDVGLNVTASGGVNLSPNEVYAPLSVG
jgi:hypothetical protein